MTLTGSIRGPLLVFAAGLLAFPCGGVAASPGTPVSAAPTFATATPSRVEPAPRPDPIHRIYDRAVELYQEGHPDRARALFEQVAESREASAALRESAEAYRIRITMRTHPKAMDQSVRAFTFRFPESVHALPLHREAGHLKLQMGDPRGAYRQFDLAGAYPGTDGDRARLLYWMAEAAVAYGELQTARERFIELADTYPNFSDTPNALYACGRLHLEEEQFEAAAEVFERLKASYPFNPVTRRVGTALGESYYQQGRYELAADALIQALPYLDEVNTRKAVYLIAESYNALERFRDATRYYLQTINLTEGLPEERMAHYGLGWVYHKQEIYHWAARSFQRAATRGEPTDGALPAAGDLERDELGRKALYYTAVNQKLAGRYDLAVDAFRLFHEQYPEGLFAEEGAFELAVTAFEMGRHGESIETLLPLARRLETLKRPGEVLTFLGEAYFANGEYTRALQTFELAESRIEVPEQAKIQARFQKAWVQYSNQAYAQALPVFESVRRIHPDSEVAPEALFWEADTRFQTGDYEGAAETFDEFIALHPTHAFIGAAYYAKAWSHFMSGDFERVLEPMRAFLERYEPPPIALFPYETDAVLRLGDAYFALGRYEEAVETYRRAYGAEPAGDYAMFQVANSYFRMGRNFEAVSEFRKLLRIYPFTFVREQAQYNIAYIYLETGNYQQAISEFQTLIVRVPGTEWAARAQFAIGDAYYNAGEYAESVRAYEQVLRDYPRSDYVIEAINGIQYAQLSSGEEDRSTQMLQSFLDSHPSSTTADRLRFRQAENRMQVGDYTGAVKEFEQYIRITNRTDRLPDAWTNIADAKFRMGDLDGAAEAWEHLAGTYPASEQAASALASLGRLAYDRGEFEASMAYYRRLRETGNRYDQSARVGIGRAHLALGETVPARREFEAVLEVNAANGAARNGLGEVLISGGEYAAARELLEPVTRQGISESGAEAMVLIGRSHRLEGDEAAALEAYGKVQTLYQAFDEWVAQSIYESAVIHILQGEPGKARSRLQEILQSYAGTRAAATAADLLERVP